MNQPEQVLRKPKKRDTKLFANWYLNRNRKKIEELDLEILRMIEDSDGILSDDDLLTKLCGKRIGVKRELNRIKTRLLNNGYVSNMPISDMSHITSIGRDALENGLKQIYDRTDIAQVGNQSPLSQTFKVGHTYSRQKDLHDKYGGNRQSGISQCAYNPYIFLFHTSRSSAYEYKDGWITDDTYIYSGEGRDGDMDFTRGNQAILEHSKNHKELHLFQQISSGSYKYVGQFYYDHHEIDSVKRANEIPRRIIRFVLKRI